MTGMLLRALDGIGLVSNLEWKYAGFADTARAKLDAIHYELGRQVLRVIFEEHGQDAQAPILDVFPACLAYARRVPFEHTAITDDEVAAAVAEIGEDGMVALAVHAALVDAEVRLARAGYFKVLRASQHAQGAARRE